MGFENLERFAVLRGSVLFSNETCVWEHRPGFRRGHRRRQIPGHMEHFFKASISLAKTGFAAQSGNSLEQKSHIFRIWSLLPELTFTHRKFWKNWDLIIGFYAPDRKKLFRSCTEKPEKCYRVRPQFL